MLRASGHYAQGQPCSVMNSTLSTNPIFTAYCMVLAVQRRPSLCAIRSSHRLFPLLLPQILQTGS